MTNLPRFFTLRLLLLIALSFLIIPILSFVVPSVEDIHCEEELDV